MTTHLPSQDQNNNNAGPGAGASDYVPYTPPITDADLDRYGFGQQQQQRSQHNGQQTTSPMASPKSPRRDLSYANPPKSLEGLEKKKRKYSAGIYKWTQVMWESARQDIERRASVSSTDSDATSTYGAEDEKAPVRNENGTETTRDISNVPALH
ncbi:hypothetical protein IAT40_001573 [Kwoniella sp. CBS 6097]